MYAITKQINGLIGSEPGDRLVCFDLNKFLSDRCGYTWIAMEQEEICDRLADAGISFNEEDYDSAINKINAIKTFLLSDSFFVDPNVFEKIVLAINDKYVDPDLDQDVDIADIVFAFRELKSIVDFEAVFSSEVRAETAIAAANDGLVVLPEELSFAQDKLDKINSRTIKDLQQIKSRVAERLEKKIDELDDNDMVDLQAIKLKRIHLCCEIRKAIRLEDKC
jgi:hypothetical protein